VLDALSTLRWQMDKLIEVPTREQLSERREANRQEKVQLWEQYKIGAFARLHLSVYAVCLMTVYKHLQLSILAKYTYIDGMHKRNESEALLGASFVNTTKVDWAHRRPLSDEEKAAYLLLSSNFFLERGLESMATKVKRAVVPIVSTVPLTKRCTPADIQHIFADIRNALEKEISEFAVYLLPPQSSNQASSNNSNSSSAQVESLLNETRSLLYSESFHSLVRELLALLFALLHSQAADVIGSASSNFGSSSVGGLEMPSAPSTPAPSSSSAAETSSALPLARRLPHVIEYINQRILPEDPLGGHADFLRSLCGSRLLLDFSRNVFALLDNNGSVSRL